MRSGCFLAVIAMNALKHLIHYSIVLILNFSFSFFFLSASNNSRTVGSSAPSLAGKSWDKSINSPCQIASAIFSGIGGDEELTTIAFLEDDLSRAFSGNKSVS